MHTDPYCTCFVQCCVYDYYTSSFKSEKFLLLQFQSKPKRPWRAQDAGAFFIKFYLVTFLLVGVAVTYFTLSSNTFAKSCAMQDASVGLCLTSALDSNNACALKSISRYFQALLCTAAHCNVRTSAL
jgi:hypothetical protein